MYPWHLKGTPYTVQTKALDKAGGRRGFAFFMEMGLGKTATAYNEFINLYSIDMVDSMIVICPQSLKEVWATEAEEWEVPIPVNIWPHHHHSPKILAINYEAIIAKGGGYVEQLLKNNKVYLVLDESIHVKPKSKTY